MPVDVSLLKEIPFFRDLTIEELYQIATIAEEIKIPVNRIVFRQGEPADAFYIILEGEVTVRKSFNKKEQRIVDMSRGALLGEMAFITGEQRTGTVKTNSAVKLLKISKEKFDLLLAGQYSLAGYKLIYRIAQILSFRLARFGEQFVSILEEDKTSGHGNESLWDHIKRFLGAD